MSAISAISVVSAIAPSAVPLKKDPEASAAPMLESKELFKGAKTVGILHNGALYRLQATKLGKLILTK